MLDPEELKLPLDERFLAFIPATVLLARLGEEQAILDVGRLWGARDERLREKVLKHQVRAEARSVEATPPRGAEQSDLTLTLIRKGLADTVGSVREQAVQLAGYYPDVRLFADLARHLADDSDKVRSRLCDSAKLCSYTDEASLEAVYPFLEYSRPDTGDEVKDKKRRREDYDVRIHAVHFLSFRHGSGVAQERLLAVFDRPELGVKKELTGAFRRCPDPAVLRQAMLERVRGADERQVLSALFVLAALPEAGMRELFHSFLTGHSARHAQAALEGLKSMLEGQDLTLLQTCRDAWQVEF
jgi:hypothetical protein